MNPTKCEHRATNTISANLDTVYDRVADITRMGERSPVCTAGLLA